jgi:hypothetical protein
MRHIYSFYADAARIALQSILAHNWSLTMNVAAM